MKESKAVKIFLWVSFAMFMLYILSLTIPLYYMILNSFKTNGDYVDNRWGLPSVFTLQSFAKAFTMRAGETTLPMMLSRKRVYRQSSAHVRQRGTTFGR